ncbi:hypothetical protein RRG08_043085 [Elysia crispata]|uniref:Uncharacterized protein n=1 Tax=Elysia crispata TaxID=231223 RepID=A0AAE0XYB9_9GAST|nr:hypothetical protein RRG08_043085 [Elysia crispata]
MIRAPSSGTLQQQDSLQSRVELEFRPCFPLKEFYRGDNSVVTSRPFVKLIAEVVLCRVQSTLKDPGEIADLLHRGPENVCGARRLPLKPADLGERKIRVSETRAGQLIAALCHRVADTFITISHYVWEIVSSDPITATLSFDETLTSFKEGFINYLPKTRQ